MSIDKKYSFDTVTPIQKLYFNTMSFDLNRSCKGEKSLSTGKRVIVVFMLKRVG